MKVLIVYAKESRATIFATWGGRQGGSDRPVRREFPDAQPSSKPHCDDLHRHWQCADAGNDREAAALAQVGQVRQRQADAVLRRAHTAGTASFRSLQTLPRDFIEPLRSAGP